MPQQPALFISHGAPTVLIEDASAARRFMSNFATRLKERPRAILVVSAHWETDAPLVSNVERPETIYDFYGFPDQMYQHSYDAPGAPDLAARVADLVPGTKIDTSRGLDHGAWVPAKLIWPEADIPITQLSIQPRKDPAWHYELGRKLAPLRDEGVLIMASGAMTHNLRTLQIGKSCAADTMTRIFTDWMMEKLEIGDTAALLNYRAEAPDATYAHPTDEHLLPLFVAAGAGSEARLIHHGYEHGNLAMTSYAFH